VNALESRDLPALRRIWPTLSPAQARAIANEIGGGTKVEVQVGIRRIDVRGDAASVVFNRRVSVGWADGRTRSSDLVLRMRLEKEGAGWLIRGVMVQERPLERQPAG
jgi:hypothetical protein